MSEKRELSLSQGEIENILSIHGPDHAANLYGQLIYNMTVEGLSDFEIAEALNISQKSVKKIKKTVQTRLAQEVRTTDVYYFIKESLDYSNKLKRKAASIMDADGQRPGTVLKAIEAANNVEKTRIQLLDKSGIFNNAREDELKQREIDEAEAKLSASEKEAITLRSMLADALKPDNTSKNVRDVDE